MKYKEESTGKPDPEGAIFLQQTRLPIANWKNIQQPGEGLHKACLRLWWSNNFTDSYIAVGKAVVRKLDVSMLTENDGSLNTQLGEISAINRMNFVKRKGHSTPKPTIRKFEIMIFF